MSVSKRILAFVIILGVLILASCQNQQTPSAGIPVTPEMLESVSRSLLEMTSVLESSEEDQVNDSQVSTAIETNAEFDPSTDVVYWTEGGSVYHVTDQCSTLKHSDHILYGSVEEALSAKKERPCKTCS